MAPPFRKLFSFEFREYTFFFSPPRRRGWASLRSYPSFEVPPARPVRFLWNQRSSSIFFFLRRGFFPFFFQVNQLRTCSSSFCRNSPWDFPSQRVFFPPLFLFPAGLSQFLLCRNRKDSFFFPPWNPGTNRKRGRFFPQGNPHFDKTLALFH